MQLKVVVVGAGYVGLVSGACFADLGAKVVCVDRDQARVDRLRQGDVPIYEPGLDALLAQVIEAGQISFDTRLAEHVPDADLIFIAVGTPCAPDGYPDLSQVESVAQDIAPHLSGHTVVVTKSTVPPGTGRWLEERLQVLNPAADVDVASNPEFLREGNAIGDFMRPDRVVLGTESERARVVLQELYRPLEEQGAPILVTTRETAELIKYASNAFLATKITFINDLADLCESFGADVEIVARGMGLDHRIGPYFLRAGPGFGGSCFPKDTRGLVAAATRRGMALPLVERVIERNDARKRAMAEKVQRALEGDLKGRRIAVLGVTFKAETDDMREAPSLDILPALQKEGARLQVYDPAGRSQAEALLPDVNWHECPYGAAAEADALLILTEWSEFRELDLGRLRSLLRQPTIIDLRNLFAPEQMRDAGFTYHSVGRPAVNAGASKEVIVAAE